jgi:S-DNA-T family DNA segregation ATPase FtsK/SpoIIIE
VNRRWKDVWAICLLAGAVFALVSLYSESAGVVGAWLAGVLRYSVGRAAGLPPLLTIGAASMLLRSKGLSGDWRRGAAVFLSFVVLVTGLQLVYERRLSSELVMVLPPPTAGAGGGVLGAVLAGASVRAFGFFGTVIILVALTLIAIVLCVDRPMGHVVKKIAAWLIPLLRLSGRRLRRLAETLIGSARYAFRRWQDNQALRRARRATKPGLRRNLSAYKNEERAPRKGGKRSRSSESPADGDDAGKVSRSEEAVETAPLAQAEESAESEIVSGQASENSAAITSPEPSEAVAASAESQIEPFYQLPPVALFDRPRVKRKVSHEPDQRGLLEQTLATFGVEAKVVSVSQGPVVTRYELQPAPGVAVKRITSLADDLALNLAAVGVRIEAPVPGRSVVGIEVPNKETSVVAFREIAESEAFVKCRSRLAIVIGADIAGNPVVGDLCRLLHLLIAGATGSGKSVCLNALISSLLLKAKPHEVKLLLIDPKRVELAVYEGIPHLLAPVVTDPKEASGALRWAVREMESRFQRFAERGARNIDGYNRLILQEESTEEPLPYIVTIIDELADLMMVAKGDVEESICRLAQMGRAAGMYLVVATQRPSVDVITGLIKANVPSRIAFAVSSGVDSRVILDQVGAERLLGKGDMLYHPIGASKPIRAQGSFVSDKEVAALVEFWKARGTPEYQESLFQVQQEGTEIAAEADDELFEDACRLVVETGTASISMIQRRFRVGYARAARLIDMMELRGIVGPYQGSKPREVLVSPDELDGIAM